MRVAPFPCGLGGFRTRKGDARLLREGREPGATTKEAAPCTKGFAFDRTRPGGMEQWRSGGREWCSETDGSGGEGGDVAPQPWGLERFQSGEASGAGRRDGAVIAAGKGGDDRTRLAWGFGDRAPLRCPRLEIRAPLGQRPAVHGGLVLFLARPTAASSIELPP
jgi:hypothetical protein